MTSKELRGIVKRDLDYLKRRMGSLGRDVGRESPDRISLLIDLERAATTTRETLDMLEGR